MKSTEPVLVVCLLAGLAGCAWPASPQSHTDRATLAACRDYASRVYDERNRGDIYSINQAATPGSGSYIRDYGTHDLAAKYGNDQVIDDCVRNTGTETNREDTATPSGNPPPPSGQPPSGNRP